MRIIVIFDPGNRRASRDPGRRLGNLIDRYPGGLLGLSRGLAERGRRRGFLA
jgi:hypothetical protein